MDVDFDAPVETGDEGGAASAEGVETEFTEAVEAAGGNISTEEADEAPAQNGGSDPKPEPAAKAEPAEPKGVDLDATLTIKVDGEDQEVSVKELKKGYQLAQASYKRFEEAKGLKAEAEKAKEQMKGLATAMRDPERIVDVLVRIGHKPADIRARLDAYEAVPATDRQRAELERRQQELDERERQWQEQERQRQQQAQVAQAREHLQQQAREAMGAVGKNSVALSYWAEALAKARRYGIDMDAQGAADEALARVKRETEAWDRERLVKTFGEEGANQLRPEAAPKQPPPRPGKRVQAEPSARRSRRKVVKMSEIDDPTEFFNNP